MASSPMSTVLLIFLSSTWLFKGLFFVNKTSRGCFSCKPWVRVEFLFFLLLSPATWPSSIAGRPGVGGTSHTPCFPWQQWSWPSEAAATQAPRSPRRCRVTQLRSNSKWHNKRRGKQEKFREHIQWIKYLGRLEMHLKSKNTHFQLDINCRMDKNQFMGRNRTLSFTLR